MASHSADHVVNNLCRQVIMCVNQKAKRECLNSCTVSLFNYMYMNKHTVLKVSPLLSFQLHCTNKHFFSPNLDLIKAAVVIVREKESFEVVVIRAHMFPRQPSVHCRPGQVEPAYIEYGNGAAVM